MMRKKFYRFVILFAILFAAAELSVEASTVYTVKKGDTLWDIAQANEVSVEHLMEWNALHSTVIYPNQSLTIEKLQDEYMIKKGDTLSEIAEAHNVSLSTLMSMNNMTSHLIYAGDHLSLTPSNKQYGQTERKIVERPTKEVSRMTKTETKTEKEPSTKETNTQSKSKQTVEQKNHEKKKEETANTSSALKGKEMTVTATAYTAYCDGCSGTTYTGINLRANPNQKVIAVDPSVIPLGSKVWVEGYGEAIAGDIGGAIKGNKIDVFLEQKADAYKWGRKQVKIKVLE